MISVIVPVYNVEKYLGRCIESILNQTYRDLEIILVDDGSTDGSGEICDKYAANDRRIKVIHKSNEGVSVARNTGMKACHGEYISFIDSDDWIEKEMFLVLQEKIEMTDADFAVCGDFRVYQKEDGSYEKKKTNRWPEVQDYLVVDKAGIYRKIIAETCVVWNKLFRRECVINVSFVPNMSAEDNVFMMDVLPRLEKAVIVNHYLYNYFVNRPGNVVSGKADKKTMQFLKYSEFVYEKMRREGYPEVGIKRIHIALNDVTKKFSMNALKENREYYLECKRLAKKPVIKDVLRYCFSDLGSRRWRMSFLAFRIDPLLVIMKNNIKNVRY